MFGFGKTSKNGKTTPPPATPAPHDEMWRSGRSRFGLQAIRRGRDKKWHFAGQQANEEVRLIVREHKLFLIPAALPFLIAITACVVVAGESAAQPALRPIWFPLLILLGIVTLVAFAWFIWRDFIEWWLETYIITNKRIITSRGLLEPVRQTTEIEKVTQVGIDLEWWGVFFHYGTLHVYYAGGELVMKHLPNPKQVKDAIQGISDDFKAKKKEKEKPPVPADPDMANLLTALAKGKEVPTLPDADKHLTQLHPDRFRGPQRTFGGPLRIPCGVHYTTGETTVDYIQRSRYVLYRNLAPSFALLLFALPLSIYLPISGLVSRTAITGWVALSGTVILALLIWAAVVYINYSDDVYILTSNRIIDIDRRLVFFYESRIETEYKNIRDIKVKVPNVLERLLDIGDVYIETPGNSPDIIFKSVDHPFFIQDKIYGIKGHSEKVSQIKKENENLENLHMWFAKVVTKLEEKNQTKKVPDLQSQDYLSAMTMATQCGLVIKVTSECSSNQIPPGYVLQQIPPPGTIVSQGGEIHVVLSRNP